MSSTNPHYTSEFSGSFRAGRDVLAGNTYSAAGNIYFGDSGQSDDVVAQGQRLLESLRFGEMNVRQHDVASLVDDFGLTCQWILTPGEDHGFLEWCEHGDGIFWIRGLPGTGKSTLMDFLDEQLQEHHQKLIADPASPRSVQLLKFFFYSSRDSTKLQNSFPGLLRALCYQILSQNDRELLHDLVKDSSAPRSVRSRLAAADLPTWTTRDLKEFLRYLVPKSSRRFFCLLDGLDECTEDHNKLLSLLDELVNLGLKLCCTSRPDEPFLNGLQGLPSMELHHVNARDIRDFCRRNLLTTPAAHLIETIVSMARGVFLWAGLVTLDIRRASAFASDEELASRLQHCPTDMLDLYEHLIERQAIDEYR